MGCINIAVKKLPSSVANNIKKKKYSTHAKTNYRYFDNSNSKLKPYKIQNVTVIENRNLENEEDFAKDTAKVIEEAYLFSGYFGIYGLFFSLIFLQVIFLARTISMGRYK